MSVGRIFRILVHFLVINIILFVLTSPFVVFYGPFKNVRNTVIGAVATSMHYHNLLAYFMSNEEFHRVMAESQNVVGDISEKIFHFQNSHSDAVKLVKIDGGRFKGYMLEISDPTRIKVGISESLEKKGQTTSQIAKQNEAVAAVNAGGFIDPRGTGTGKLPFGVIIHNGYFVAGEDLPGKVPLVGFNKEGLLITGSYTVNKMKEMGITEGISFYPPLIVNGKKEIKGGDGGWGIAPRTAIGQKKDGTILLLVIDGRQPHYSLGATLLDVQNIMYDNGAYVAANLDGGSSTTMYYNGKVINRPSDVLGERSISTAFIVK